MLAGIADQTVARVFLCHGNMNIIEAVVE
jgi:hypothetical protein